MLLARRPVHSRRMRAVQASRQGATAVHCPRKMTPSAMLPAVKHAHVSYRVTLSCIYAFHLPLRRLLRGTLNRRELCADPGEQPAAEFSARPSQALLQILRPIYKWRLNDMLICHAISIFASSPHWREHSQAMSMLMPYESNSFLLQYKVQGRCVSANGNIALVYGIIEP